MFFQSHIISIKIKKYLNVSKTLFYYVTEFYYNENLKPSKPLILVIEPIYSIEPSGDESHIITNFLDL